MAAMGPGFRTKAVSKTTVCAKQSPSHRSAIEFVNPRAIRFSHNTIAASIDTPLGHRPLDVVIEEVLSQGALPKWPPICVVWVEEGDDSAFRAIDGNRRLYISRVAWSHGVIGGMAVQVCERHDARIARKLPSALSNACHGHEVEVRQLGDQGRNNQTSKYAANQTDRQLQEHLHLFVQEAEAGHPQFAGIANDTITSLRKNRFGSVDQLHKLTPRLAKFCDVPMNFLAHVQTLLQRPSAHGDLLLAEGSWVSDSGEQWVIRSSMLRGDCGQLFMLEATAQGLRVRSQVESTAICIIFQTADEDIRLLKWSGVANGLTGTWKWRGLMPHTQPEGLGTEVVLDARRNEHPPQNCLETSLVAVQREKSNSVPEDSEEPETVCAEDASSQPALAIIRAKTRRFIVVYASSAGEDVVRDGASILDWASGSGSKSEVLADSGSGVSGRPFASEISSALAKLGGIWASTHWQLRAEEGCDDIQALGLQSTLLGRKRASKVALAISCKLRQCRGGEIPSSDWPEVDSILGRATRLWEQTGHVISQHSASSVSDVGGHGGVAVGPGISSISAAGRSPNKSGTYTRQNAKSEFSTFGRMTPTSAEGRDKTPVSGIHSHGGESRINSPRSSRAYCASVSPESSDARDVTAELSPRGVKRPLSSVPFHVTGPPNRSLPGSPSARSRPKGGAAAVMSRQLATARRPIGQGQLAAIGMPPIVR